MSEQPVFWLGGKPGKPQAAEAPAAGDLEPAIRRACEAQGVAPGEFVAALGGYGSWLVQFAGADGRRRRVVWDGRKSKLVLQAALPRGGWEDLAECDVVTADEAGFGRGIAGLLGSAETSQG